MLLNKKEQQSFYSQLIKDYLEDDYTTVKCLTLDKNLCQVIEVNWGDVVPDIYHYEGKTFKEIFYENFAVNFLDAVECYDYMFEDYPWLAEELIWNASNMISKKDLSYLLYIVKNGFEPYYEWEKETIKEDL